MLAPLVDEITKRRIEAGLSKHQLSLKSNLSGCAISRLESRKTTKTHPLRAKEIARALGCKVSDIFTEINKEA